MGSSINKSFLKLLTITGALSALLLSGCGGGGGSTQSTLPNEGKALNSLGYYGDGVYFGSKPILGTWQVDKEYRTFKSDGTVSIDYFGSGSLASLAYGVNADGTQVTIHFPSGYSTKTEIGTIIEENACLNVTLFQTTVGDDRNITTQYCKRNPSATLEPISNAGKATNAYGYYGEGVKFGNELVVGNWGSVLLDNTGSGDGDIRISFDANGSLSCYISNSYSCGTCGYSVGTYGISEDGKTMHWWASTNYEIIGLFEGCYLMRDSSGNNHKLCKMEDNDTSWVVYPSYP